MLSNPGHGNPKRLEGTRTSFLLSTEKPLCMKGKMTSRTKKMSTVAFRLFRIYSSNQNSHPNLSQEHEKGGPCPEKLQYNHVGIYFPMTTCSMTHKMRRAFLFSFLFLSWSLPHYNAK